MRLENAIYAYAMYVWKGVLAGVAGGVLSSPWRHARRLATGVAALFLLSVSALVWWQRAARPYLIIGWLWFLGTLVPVIGLVQVGEQAIADRYAYIPLIGIFVMAVWGAADLADSRQLSSARAPKWPRSSWRFSCFLPATNFDIGGALSICGRTPSTSQKTVSWREQNLGAALLATDRYAEALPHFQRAIKLRPLNSGAHLNLAGDLALSDRPRDAILEYETAIPLDSDPKDAGRGLRTLSAGCTANSDSMPRRAQVTRQRCGSTPRVPNAREGLAKVELSDAIRNVAESPSGEAYFRLGQVFSRRAALRKPRSTYEQALSSTRNWKKRGEALDALISKV